MCSSPMYLFSPIIHGKFMRAIFPPRPTRTFFSDEILLRFSFLGEVLPSTPLFPF